MTEVWQPANPEFVQHAAAPALSRGARKAAAMSLLTARRAHGDMPPQLRKAPSQSRSRMLVDSVKQACLIALEQRGAQQLSVSAIVEISGVTFGSIYQYFPNLDGIIAAIYDDAITAALARASEEGNVDAVMQSLRTHLETLDAGFERDFYSRYYSAMLDSLTDTTLAKAS